MSKCTKCREGLFVTLIPCPWLPNKYVISIIYDNLKNMPQNKILSVPFIVHISRSNCTKFCVNQLNTREKNCMGADGVRGILLF